MSGERYYDEQTELQRRLDKLAIKEREDAKRAALRAARRGRTASAVIEWTPEEARLNRFESHHDSAREIEIRT